MISYKLAKKLKDAGFPIKRVGEGGKGEIINYSENIEYVDFAYLPTLSELIETCGDGFRYLEREGNNWYARTPSRIGMSYFLENGKTPEIAVAKLWLKLNKK